MFSRLQAEHQAESVAPATKGPAFKQATEEVDALASVLAPYLSQIDGPSLSDDEAATARAVLEPAIERTLGLSDRVNKMRAKANEPDPELQTYGPVMKEKVFQLCVRYDELLRGAEMLKGRYWSVFDGERERQEGAKREEAAAEKRQEEENARREEEEGRRQLKQAEEERRRAEAEKRAEEQDLAKQRAIAREKMEEAAERERSAARGGSALAVDREDPFVAVPIGEGNEELSLELAIALAHRADQRMAAFKEACGAVLQENPEKALEAGRTMRAYLLNILADPRSRDFRTIPQSNAIYCQKIACLEKGRDAMVALGFEEVEEEEEEGKKGRRLLVMNTIVVDEVRAFVSFLDQATRR